MSRYNNLLLAQRSERQHFRDLHGYDRRGRISDHHIEEWENMVAGQARERCLYAQHEFRVALFFELMFARYRSDTGAHDSERMRRRFYDDCFVMLAANGETLDQLMDMMGEFDGQAG